MCFGTRYKPLNPDEGNNVNVYAILDGQILGIGDYLIRNSVADKFVSLTHNQQIGATFYRSALISDWEWNWSSGDSTSVKGYPEVISGYSPLINLQSKNSKGLPAVLSNLPNLIVNYNLSISASGDSIYNTAFDLWIARNLFSIKTDITNEVMIWVNSNGMSISSTFLVGRFTIDGFDYDLYTHPPIYPSVGTYFAFIKVIGVTTGTVNIKSFITCLLINGYLSYTDYLEDIEFGNEIRYGSGKTTVMSYSIGN